MTHVPLHLLETLLVVGDERNLVRAAKKLGLTQPTLSRHLKELETRLPFPLFVTQGRNKVFTSYGNDIYIALKPRLEDIPVAIERVNSNFANVDKAKLRIVGRREILQPYTPRLQFEGILSFSYMGGPQVLEALRQRRADIGVTQRRPVSSEIIAKPLLKKRFKLVVPKKYAATKLNFSSPALKPILNTRPHVSFSEQIPVMTSLLSELGLNHDALKVSRICDDWGSLKEMVGAQLGWAVLPESDFFEESRFWLIDLPEKINEEVPFYLLYPKDLIKISWFKEFINSWPKDPL